jgi:competence protein ComEA
MIKNWRMIAISLICGLLATGAVWLVSRPPRGEAVRLKSPPTLEPLVVHVSGAVTRPGVYNLPAGSRIKDALLAAGNTTSGADPEALNLAAPLEDGVKIVVPLLNPPTASPQPSSFSSTPAVSDNLAAGPININQATQAELESLPGIGPVIAQRIIAYREENGPFTTTEAIQNVAGIGPATFEDIESLITVGGIP